MDTIEAPRVVSRDAWLAERKAHLAAEKELTRQRDELARQRRRLPWTRVETPYVFEGPGGPVTLDELFDGRGQLLVQHFMFHPDWTEGCVGCSFMADHVDAARRHFVHRDLAFAAVARAPIARIEAFRARMGWTFPWVSSGGNSFNYDFGVSFTPEQLRAGKVTYNYTEIETAMEDLPGVSVFARDLTGAIHHTYSSFGRGDELLIGAYNFLDLTPKGRDEGGARGDMTDWVRHHDRYDAPLPGPVAFGVPAATAGPCCG